MVPDTFICSPLSAHLYLLFVDGGAGGDVLLGYGNDDVLLGGKDQLMRNCAVKLALTR